MDTKVGDYVKVYYDAPPGSKGWVPRLSRDKYCVVAVNGEKITVLKDHPRRLDREFCPTRWESVPAPVRRPGTGNCRMRHPLTGALVPYDVFVKAEIERLMEKDD